MSNPAADQQSSPQSSSQPLNIQPVQRAQGEQAEAEYPVLKIVLIDDNFIMREVIKSMLEHLEQNYQVNFKIYSSDNGVEGLGYTYVLNPDLIIVDSTLPKYSGREVMSYLVSNQKFHIENRVIVMAQSEVLDEMPDNFTKVTKGVMTFLPQLAYEVEQLLRIRAITKISALNLARFRLSRATLGWANTSDLLISHYYRTDIVTKLAIGVLWLLTQVVLSLHYMAFRLIATVPPDESVEQQKRDYAAYRVRYYPTLVTFFTSVFILILQVALFYGGSVVLLGFRIDDVFALSDDQRTIEFSLDNADSFEFDTENVQITPAGITLREQTIEQTQSRSSREPGTGVVVQDNSDGSPGTDTNVDIDSGNSAEQIVARGGSEAGVLDEPNVPGQAEVLAFSTTFDDSQRVEYPTEAQVVTLRQPIEFSKFVGLIELSDINNEFTSQESRFGPRISSPNPEKQIGYKLSPNGVNWYYYSEDANSWITDAGRAELANDVRQINNNAARYQQQFGAGDLYVRLVILSKEGNTAPVLNRLIVNKENYLVTQLGT